MLFIIHAIDAADAPAKRKEHYDRHRAHVADASAFGLQVVMSGPLTKDDGASPIGSFFLLETPDRAAVEKFHHADPFYQTGVWDAVTITAFLKR